MTFDRFVGIPYVDRGRDYDGVDCWGLVWLVYRDQVGIEIPSYADDYEDSQIRAECADRIAAGIRHWRERAPGAEQPGDAVLIRSGRHICHVGVLTDTGGILHCEEGTDTIISDRAAPTIRNRILGYYCYEPRPARP